ncbi:MAG: dTDP-glucose 4,6-dehydratase [Anaerolineaceae bacterium]|nr:dTDP-glucose 4,6-dehydratase [Anaerolineaceae bacterium]
MRSVLVTGGAGFIGANFIRTLISSDPNLKIVNLDALTYAGTKENLKDVEENEAYTFVEGFVEDLELLGALFVHHQFDIVVHFAAETHVDRSILEPSAFIRSNVQGTYAVLEAARTHWKGNLSENQVHLVSTDEVFGSLEAGDRPSKENSVYRPRSPYAATKASGDHLGMAYYHTYGLPISISHGSNTYGPYQYPEKLVPLVILRCLRGEPIPIYGDGQQVRDWLFVQDHCEAVLRILQKGQAGESYNVGGYDQVTNLQVVERICAILDQRIPVAGSYRDLITFVQDRPGHDQRYTVDTLKMAKMLDWSPAFSLEDGLASTVDWYLLHKDWINSAAQHSSYRHWERTQYQNR